ncbi:MAG TPA: glycosyltransferase 87 family protein [Ktedonobacteraceae bacterium]|nr:glycosyltransferase 87 family protein [Ktedonobacteraceae bacterium]
MAQRSVFTQATRPGVKHILTHQWMRFFFTEDTSADNSLIAELQRRAAWIGLVFILQALNEIDHDWYIPYLMPVGSLIPFALILGSFYAMWMAIRPARPQQKVRSTQRLARWQRIILTLTLLLTIAGGIELGRGLMMCFLPPQFSNDGTSLDTNAAILLIEGHNPYTDSNMLDLARRFPIQPNWTTPLRVGQFANRLDYPTMVEFKTVLDTDLKAGTAPEFESKVSYPALSFLTLLPFALFKNYNVLPFYMLSYALLVVVAWKVAHPALRPWVLLLTLANVPMWSSTVGGNLDIFYTLLIVLAWLLRDQRWYSAVFLGLALASKQIAWFFIPFYLIMIYRQHGLKETMYRMTIAGSIGLAINLPFILWNPQAWAAGVLAPVVDPMFPMGVGLINLSVTHLLPFFPQWVYSALEGTAMLLSLAWYWRFCQKCPEAAMLLAVIPLFFAWRSLPSYFYCSAFPIFILLIAKMRPSPQTATARESRMRKRVGIIAPVSI